MFEGFLNRIDTVLANVFAQTWLNISLAVTPVLVGAVTILVALYGLSIAFGRDFNFHDFMALIIRIAVTYLLITATFFFLTIIYDPVTETPGELATTIVAGTQTTNVNKLIDTFMVAGWNAIARLQAEGGIFNPGAFLLALIMMVATLLVGAVSFVVFALAKTVLTLSLMLAPVFIAFLAFQATRGWFESWLRMLFQSGLVIVLASGTMAIIMELSKDGLRTLRNATTNNNITLTDCVAYLTIAFVAVILLPQLNNIAASLAAGGASLSYHGASRAAHRAQRSLGRSDHEKAKRRWEGPEGRPVTSTGSVINSAAGAAGAGVRQYVSWRDNDLARSGKGRAATSPPASPQTQKPRFDPRDRSAKAIMWRAEQDRLADAAAANRLKKG